MAASARHSGQRMIRAAAAAVAALLAAALCGCPESVNPVADPSRAAPDPALFGVWHGTFDGDDMYLHVGPGERGMTRAVQVEHKKKGNIETAQFAAYPTRIGKLDLLNVRQTDGVADFRGYLFFRYQLKGAKLTLWMLSLKAVREDIKAGKLAGKAAGGEYGETLITASSEDLARYLQEGDAARLFDHPLVFRRMARR